MMIAYFSAEFGIDSNIPTYAGGLGILAGDIMLEAAEQNTPLVGIGFMHHGRRFIQRINDQGEQYEEATPFRLDGSPCWRRVEIAGKAIEVTVRVKDSDVKIQAYRQRLGDNTQLLFLTTDVEGNEDYFRNLFDELYWGDQNAQIAQQILLGVGGVRFLEAAKIRADIFHFNEGRPVFALWEIAANLKNRKKISGVEALAAATELIVYTNHTLVAAGNLSYPMDLIRSFAGHYAEALGVSADELLSGGVVNDQFAITEYALAHSRVASAVSKPHGKLSAKTWPNFTWVSITNGVNMSRWQKKEFSGIHDDSQLWAKHLECKVELAREVERRVGFGYDPSRLVISWARRISGYKQVSRLFDDVTRLSAILKNSDRPVQLLIAGKAHPGDTEGKDVIKRIIHEMAGPLAGNALFVPNYDIALSQLLTSGSDVWANTPEPGKEACGTSGMKAIANGVLQATVLDGWTSEVEWEGIGWVLNPESLSESFYDTLEHEISPKYYTRGENNMPHEWIERMKKSILLAEKYSSKRMLLEYQKKLYEV